MSADAGAPQPEIVSDLFAGVRYFLNDSIPALLRQKLELLLLSHAAKPCPAPPTPPKPSTLSLPTSARFDVQQCTHVISDTSDLPEADWLVGSNRLGRDKDGPAKHSVEIVTPLWITRSIDLQNVQQATFYSPLKHLVFSGMCFCTSDLPEADNLAIAAGVSSLGGQWKRELTREVTHLFVVAPAGAKFTAAMKYGPELGMVTLLPHWFEECLKLSQLVPIEPYQFPDPPLLRTDTSQEVVPFAERITAYHSALPPPHRNIPAQPTTATADAFGAYPFGPEWGKDALAVYQKTATVNLDRSLLDPLPAGRNSDSVPGSTLLKSESGAGGKRWPLQQRVPQCAERIFAGHSVYFASDLGLREGLEAALQARIVAAGGSCFSWAIDGRRESVVPPSTHSQWDRRKVAERGLREADIVITKTREGWEYWLAFDQQKKIGNLAWMYHVLAAGTLSSPLDRLLHYPIPHTQGVQAFHSLVFTISNYAGPARDYVRTLIETLGATFQGAMTKKTDYVVSASDFGAKVEHAKSWQIPLVTHVWLEQCLTEWRLVNPAASQAYIAPVHSDTNFAAIVGQAELPKGAVDRWAAEPEQQTQRALALSPVEEGDSSREEQHDNNSLSQLGDRTEIDMDLDPPAAATRTANANAGPSCKPVSRQQQPKAQAQRRKQSPSPAPEPAALKEEEEEEEELPEPPTMDPEEAEKMSVDEDDEVPALEDDPSSTPPKAVKQAKGKPPAKAKPAPRSPASKAAPKAKSRASAPPATPSDESLSDDDDRPRAPPVGSAGARVDAGNILPARTKRGVALAAADKLHNQMADANKFAVEQRNGSAKKRRRGSSGAPPTPAPRGKSKSKEVESESEDEIAVAGEPKKGPASRAKKAGGGGRAAELAKEALPAKSSLEVSSFDNPPHAKPPALNKHSDEQPIRIMSTGLGLDAKHPDIKRLLKLAPGSSWTDNPATVTHLVVKAMSRTEKFLCALAAAPLVVTQDWVTDSLKQNRIAPESKYLLRDKAKEKEIGDTLASILDRARKHRLFDGLTLYLTPNIEPALGTLKKIVASGGGIVSNASLKTVQSTPSLRDALTRDRPQAYVVSCAKDRSLWDALASSGKGKVAVYSVEAVLTSAMYQKLVFEPRFRVDLQVER